LPVDCASCGHENPQTSRFCGDCGARLEIVCPACSRPNPPRNRFCNDCGQSLDESATGSQFESPQSYTPKHLADKILTTRSALEGERKQVTVLFADIKGSMELLAERDPEECRRILDPVLERMMAAVHRYEGTVNQVLGDGIMALFGAPIAHEDHAVRACYAALAMQGAIQRYSADVRQMHGVTIQARVGLNSGEVVVRAIGSDLHMDYSAIGQTTHLAARMEQLASPGGVLVSADTLRLVEGFVQVAPVGAVPIKGLPQPVEVFELTGVAAARTRIQAAARRGLTRFVGREREIETLSRATAETEAGHGQLVAVVGEPGVGKSRLFWEFTHSHRTQGWLLIESGSVSYGKATPYLPVIDLLKGYFKIADRDDQREIREKVTGKLLTLDRGFEPTLTAFLSLLDVPVDDPLWNALDPPQRRRRTLDAVKRLLHRESQVQPLIVVFEDLHWIDAETQALLDSFIEGLPTHRILLLVNYRPEYQHGWATKSCYTQLRIDPLPPERAEELLSALVGDDPGLGALQRALIERTGGNPFFLEESLRTLIETGVLVGEPGRLRLTSAAESIHVPETVQAVLAARIDRQQAEDKRLLQTAAVIGKDVPYTLLQAIVDLPEEALRAAISRLQAAEFLYEASLFPDLEYTFKHALTHDVAYGSLLQERRTLLHASIVDAIERVYANRLPEHIERLAYHAPRGGLWERAVSYLRRAGQKAFERSANRDAVAYFDQALEALAHLPQTESARAQEVDVLIGLRNALLPLGQIDRTAAVVKRATTLAESLSDKRRISATCTLLAFSHWRAGELTAGVDAGRRALGIAIELGDLSLEAPANTYLGYLYSSLGEFLKAKQHLARNVQLLVGPRAGELFGIAAPPGLLSRMALMNVQAELGEFEDALQLEQESKKLMEVVNHPFASSLIHMAAGRIAAAKGDFKHAIRQLEVALHLTDDWGLSVNRPMIVPVLGRCYAAAGRVHDALPLLEEGLGCAGRDTVWYQFASWQLCEGLLRMGRTVDAQRMAADALHVTTSIGARGGQAWALWLSGEMRLPADSEGLVEAEQFLRRAQALSQELGMRPLSAHCCFSMGRLYRRIAGEREACEELTSARAQYRELDMQYYLRQAEDALAGHVN
jgi:class 3 adenylate cyclase/tetratricopeptide (TPR) repeat protein